MASGCLVVVHRSFSLFGSSTVCHCAFLTTSPSTGREGSAESKKNLGEGALKAPGKAEKILPPVALHFSLFSYSIVFLVATAFLLALSPHDGSFSESRVVGLWLPPWYAWNCSSSGAASMRTDFSVALSTMSGMLETLNGLTSCLGLSPSKKMAAPVTDAKGHERGAARDSAFAAATSIESTLDSWAGSIAAYNAERVRWEDYRKDFAGSAGCNRSSEPGSESRASSRSSAKIDVEITAEGRQIPFRETFSPYLSTEENHRSSTLDFHGPYASVRSVLDYSYHSNYNRSRQILQDSIVHSMLNSTSVVDAETGQVCPSPASGQWIIFTAGAMGAGKSYAIKQLAERGLFPLDSFVTVDPDDIRRHLPEFHDYTKHCPQTAGELTRKEAGYVSEVLTLASLGSGRNVLVDGSLRDADWYQRHFERLRNEYGNLRIAILHITAPRDAVFKRAESRSRTTGRVVPQETLELALEQVPKSVEVLAPLADYFCELHNAPDADDIELTSCGESWESFQANWAQECAADPEVEWGKGRRQNVGNGVGGGVDGPDVSRGIVPHDQDVNLRSKL